MKTITIDGEEWVRKKDVDKKAERRVRQEYQLMVKDGVVHGGARVGIPNFEVWGEKRQMCTPTRVKQIYDGDIVIPAEIINTVFEGGRTHDKRTFMSAVSEELAK